MKLKTFLFTLMMAIAFLGSSQDRNIITTPEGLVVEVIARGEGPQVMPGDMVSVHYTGYLTDSTVFDSSIPRNAPFAFRVGKGQVIRGWDMGIAMLREGDKAILTIPPDLGYGSMDKGNIPPNSILIFEVEVMSVTAGVRPYDVAGKDTIFTPEGIGIIIMEDNSETPEPVAGQALTVHYSGYFTDGKLFDSSIERGQEFTFVIGLGKVIRGWDIAFTKLSVGDKARLVIPYEYAYGENGYQGAIPPKSDLVFDVEVVDIFDSKPPEPFDVSGLDTITTPSGLKIIKVLETGEPSPFPGTFIEVHYVGYFLDGKVFDTSYERGAPIRFPVGQQRVIKGWDEAMGLMRYGEKARLIIPYELAYGEAGRAGIPPMTDLVFDVYLLPMK